MNFRTLISYILLSALVLLLLSTAVQADEYRKTNTEVQAEDILKHIENGDDVNLTDCRIVGDLNVNKINLETIPNQHLYNLLSKGYNNEWIVSSRPYENLSIIKSNITIKDSFFENDLDFSSVQFNGCVDFSRTEFNDSDFCRTMFCESADFSETNFYKYADFSESDFHGFTDFSKTEFYSFAFFHGTNFCDSADFSDVNFKGSVTFTRTEFKGFAIFSGTDFYSSSQFNNVNFHNPTYFSSATFHWDANFSETNFYDSANFSWVDFYGYVNFCQSTFNDTAEFIGPKTPKSIISDGISSQVFIKYYQTQKQYQDADAVYYNYRKNSQANKDIISISKWTDILSWVVYGYGVKPTYPFYFSLGVVLLFSVIYYNVTVCLKKSNNKTSFCIRFNEPRIYKTTKSNHNPRAKGIGIRRFKEYNLNHAQKIYWKDAFYFSMATFASVNLGEWCCKDDCRKWVILEGLCGWYTLGMIFVLISKGF